MYPIALNLTRIPILLVGRGELLVRRQAQLAEAGATQVTLLPLPMGEGRGEGNDAQNPHPTFSHRERALIESVTIVMVAGLTREESQAIADAARAAGKLVNVEDVNDLCDFYFTANVRRGDLIIAVSTSGASPTLARKVRDAIAAKFGAEWEGYTQEIAQLRQKLRESGKSMKEVIEASEAYLAQKGWLS